MAHHILIADGDDLVRRALTDNLEAEGYHVLLATGDDAMELLGRHKVHLVLAECRLPEADGLSLLWYIKATYPTIPVVIMTADAALPAVVEAMRLGAEDYLVKPFDTALLLSTVKRVLKLNGNRVERDVES